MDTELIPISQVVQETGKQKSHIFKVLDRLGIERTLIKRADAKGQKVAHITSDDYELLKEYFSGVGADSNETNFDGQSDGVFYLIQLEPDHDPGRIKLGFATSIEDRLRKHKTAAPYSKVIKTWPCKLLWEKTAIECAAQGCERLYTEVFRADSVDDVENRCNEFFSLMPSIVENGKK